MPDSTDRYRRIDERLQRLEDALLGPRIKVGRLADQLGVSKDTIRRHCREEGIPLVTMHGDKWTPSEHRGEPQYVDRRAWEARGRER
jgi:DeoR/GlpR family transcriptional regulator of sugar metabolism